MFSYLLESHEVVICSFSIEEARSVFDRKFPEKLESLKQLLDSIEFTKFETPAQIDPASYPKIRDIKDLPILVSAIQSDVDILISGDKDFENIEIKKPLIFTPGEYLTLMGSE